PNVFEMAATETITSIILIKLIRVSLGTVRHPRRFKIVVIDIQITLKQMLRDFIGIRVNRAKKSGMVNITSSVNSRERSGLNTILHELTPLFTLNRSGERRVAGGGETRRGGGGGRGGCEAWRGVGTSE